MQNIKFKLVIEVDGSVSHTEDLGAECLDALANRLQDVSDNFDLFGYLAQSSSSEVRKSIAYKESISEVTIELLACDTCIDVRRNLSGQAPFREWASTEIALQFLRDDVECAKNIAGKLGDFTTADINKLGAEICAHSDPDVRNALASSWGAPKKYVKQLLSDPDPMVRASAKNTLD